MFLRIFLGVQSEYRGQEKACSYWWDLLVAFFFVHREMVQWFFFPFLFLPPRRLVRREPWYQEVVLSVFDFSPGLSFSCSVLQSNLWLRIDQVRSHVFGPVSMPQSTNAQHNHVSSSAVRGCNIVSADSYLYSTSTITFKSDWYSVLCNRRTLYRSRVRGSFLFDITE